VLKNSFTRAYTVSVCLPNKEKEINRTNSDAYSRQIYWLYCDSNTRNIGSFFGGWAPRVNNNIGRSGKNLCPENNFGHHLEPIIKTSPRDIERKRDARSSPPGHRNTTNHSMGEEATALEK